MQREGVTAPEAAGGGSEEGQPAEGVGGVWTGQGALGVFLQTYLREAGGSGLTGAGGAPGPQSRPRKYR